VRRTWPCCHRSHRLGLPCFREATYHGFCLRHNSTCFPLDCQAKWKGFLRRRREIHTR